LSTSGRTTGTVAEVLSKVAGVLLHPGGGGCIAVVHLTINQVKASLPLVQSQLEVGTANPSEIRGTPFDVQDTIGRRPRNRRKNAARPAGINIAATAEIRPQIGPVWVDGVPIDEVLGVRQAQVVEGRGEDDVDERRCPIR
jgi:hypothetical protein